MDVIVIKGNMIDRETRQNGVGWSAGSSYTLDTQDRHAVCFAFANSGKTGLSDDENTSPTIKAARNGEPAVCYGVQMDVIAIDQQSNFINVGCSENIMHTLCSDHHGTPHGVCYGISRSALKGGMNAGGMPVEENIQPAITANGCGAVCHDAPGDREESR